MTDRVTRRLFPLALTLCISIVGCDSRGSVGDEDNDTGGEGGGPPTLQAVWEENFDSDAGGWIDSSIDGSGGWCGTIEHMAPGSGSVTPSAGDGYALVQNSPCNLFWQDDGWPPTGPYSTMQGLRRTWPDSGFVVELDVHLDPAWNVGTGFDYGTMVAAQEGPPSLAWFTFHVASDSSTGSLLVGTSTVHPISYTAPRLQTTLRQDLETLDHFVIVDTGWHSLRYVYRNNEGILAVDMQIERNGERLFSTTHETSFTIAIDVGGPWEAWFVFLTEDLSLPIDEHKLLTYR